MKWILLAAMLLAILGDSRIARAETWATLKGRFIFEGEIPKRKLISISTNKKLADLKVLDESLLIDKETKGIANILVFVAPELSDSKTPIPVYPDPRGVNQPDHIITLQNLQFSPRISFMRPSQTLVFSSLESSGRMFSIHPPSERRTKFTIDAGGRFSHFSGKQASSPHVLKGLPNAAGNGYVLVRDNPCVAKTNDQGEFQIKNLPVGNWPFIAWHEKSNEAFLLKLEGKEEKWPKGEFRATVPKEGKDLGEIFVLEKTFK